ncbi:MAG: S-layer homology domain-containing protein [Clostridia bacterium]|nr:S-layer homology domain-containing protein [Clostridia bacterium]
MKKILTLILTVCTVISVFCIGTAAFTDIEDEVTEEAVATLESLGIVAGTSATKYSPNLILTRAQVCAMMIRTMDLDDSVESYKNLSLFTDVKRSSWYAGYVNLAYREGIIAGYGNGKFGPDDEMTYGQFVTMLIRLLGYTDSEVGKVWPADYVTYASKLELNENVNLTANDKVTRGDAAIILYNTLMTKAKGATNDYYYTVIGATSSVTAIILDNKVSSTTTGDLYACVIDNTSASMKYYYQENAVLDKYVGELGTLLLNSDREVVGFISDDNDYTDIIVSSAKISGITDSFGNTYKIDGSVGVISDGSIYTYNTTGYVKVNSHSNLAARFYYNDDGSILYIYLTTGTDPSTAEVAVASSDAPAFDFEDALGITDDTYYIVKNGTLTNAESLAVYDVAYYDNMTNTLRVSDRKITGYIQSASPSVSAAKKVSVLGCEIDVLQCAWDTLQGFKLGDYVTLLLTDNGDVAAAYSADVVFDEMYGILSTDGNSITLCSSGHVIKPDDISATFTLNGTIVKVDASDADRVTCSAVKGKVKVADAVDVAANTVGGVPIAPGCAIYEWSGSGYVYSLDGEYAASSTDLSEIYWTDTLDYTYVSFYHTNRLGQIDILVLSNVTGNYYEYGYLTGYKEEEGVSISQGGAVFVKAMTVTNDEYPNESQKYVNTISSASGYGGIALATYSKNHVKVSSIVRPTAITPAVTDFFLNEDDEWYMTAESTSIPVSDNVKVYVATTDKWYSGEGGLLLALSSELKMTAYYDRTLETGAQVRIIVVE